MCPTCPSPDTILCVDDERDMRLIVVRSLELAGFSVRACGSADAALAHVRAEGLPDLAVIDIRMPGHDGFWLCGELQAFCDLPIILLTAVDDEETTARAIEEVAEDYIVKPVRPRELVARVRRVLRRLPTNQRSSGLWARIDPRLEVNFSQRRLRVDGLEAELTPIESKILHVLWRNLGTTVRSDHLLRRVWPDGEVFEDSLRVHVHRLRHKLERHPQTPTVLATERGEGYRLLAERRGEEPLAPSARE
jgi:DNA-binding response OmpR family regulator